MKAIEQINEARATIREKLQIPGLNDIQKALFAGMLNALSWVADSPNATTVDRLLSGELVVPGKDPTDALSTLRGIERVPGPPNPPKGEHPREFG